MIIAIDFDGTCVDHKYPEIGLDVPKAVNTLKELVNNGHSLILHTMRSNKELVDAVKWFEERGIELWSVATNPEQSEWTDSPKCYANLYIDDAAVGAPLMRMFEFIRPCLDWSSVRRYLEIKGVL